jgi:hypothetical protein
MTAQTSAQSSPAMNFMGLLTGQLNVKNLQVTTTQSAPPNAILINPATLGLIAAVSSGLHLEVPPVAEPEVPLTLENTSLICKKLLLEGKASLTDEDVAYLSRVLDLPNEDLSKKMLDAVDAVLDLMTSFAQAQAADEAFINGELQDEDEPVEIDEADLDGRATTEDVYDFVQKFVDENGVSGPGYIGIDVDFNSPEGQEVLVESVERFRENIEETGLAPTVGEQLARALAVETARSMFYEKFIDELAQMVGYAAEEEDEDDDEGLLYDSEA